MRVMRCDFCNKDITPDKEDDRHFQLTTWDKNNRDYRVVTQLGDYHKKCIDRILSTAKLTLEEKS